MASQLLRNSCHSAISLAPVKVTINLEDPGQSSCEQSLDRQNVSSSQPQAQLEDHLENECLLSLVPCYLKEIGCKKEVERSHMSQHLQSHLQFHFKLVCDKLTKTVEELETVKKQFQEQEVDLEFVMEELEMVQGENDEHKNEMQTLKAQNQKGIEEIEDLKEQNHELKIELKMIKAQLLEQKKEFDLVVDLNEKQSNQLDMIQIVADTYELRRELSIAQASNREVKKELESVRNRLKEHVGPTVVWRVSYFQTLSNFEHSRKKLVLYCDTFYTSPHGYRIQVNLVLNVVTTQQGQAHLSLNIIILKGEYDSILPWPLMKKLKFSILDQQEDFAKRNNISCSLVPQYGNKCFQRPKAEKNQATDDILLCYQKSLEKGEYLVDGVLYLQVDVSDINNNVLP